MSTRTLIMPEIERMMLASKERMAEAAAFETCNFREYGVQWALKEVRKLLLGIGVKTQSTTYT